MLCRELTVDGLPYQFTRGTSILFDYPEEVRNRAIFRLLKKLTDTCPMDCDCDRCGGRAAGCEYDCS